MTELKIYNCQCANCRESAPHPDQQTHRQMNVFISRLDEQQRRWYVALQSNQIGTGGDQILSEITGMDEKTIRRGRQELENSLSERPSDRVRLAGAGRQEAEKKIPS